jgi:NAD/NADP transhydrogenase beta subunit
MSMNLVTLLYLIASICFIQALKGLSHPPRRAAATASAWPAWSSPC